MTESRRSTGVSPKRVVVMALNGDNDSAELIIAQRFPAADVKTIARADVERQGFVARLKTLKSYKPDVFAVFMESVIWQRGQNLARMFGAFAGAKRIIMFDSRGGFLDETRRQVIAKAPQRLTRDASESLSAIITSRRRVEQLERALEKAKTRSDFKSCNPLSQILFLRATPGAGTQAGGAATHINGFINAAIDLGATVRVIANDEIAGLDLQKVPVKVFPLEPSGLTRAAFDLHNNLVFTKHVLSEIQAALPDVIYQRYSRFTWAGVEASLQTGRPLFLEYNGSEVWVGRHWDDAGMFSLLERVERLNLSAAARIFVVSEVERQNLLRAGISNQKIVVNPNGVDVDKFRPAVGGTNERTNLGISPDETLVGFIGTFGPWHGVVELARAITLIPGESIQFLLIGDGKLRQEAEHIIAAAGLKDRVIFARSVEHALVPSLLDACDILVSPHVPLEGGADFFGSPTKIFEYMAMGKGIVASRLGQIAEVLTHEQTALLVEPGNVEELARAIERLAELPELRQRLGAAAREAAIERHTWKRNAQNVINAYQEWAAG